MVWIRPKDFSLCQVIGFLIFFFWPPLHPDFAVTVQHYGTAWTGCTDGRNLPSTRARMKKVHLLTWYFHWPAYYANRISLDLLRPLAISHAICIGHSKGKSCHQFEPDTNFSEKSIRQRGAPCHALDILNFVLSLVVVREQAWMQHSCTGLIRAVYALENNSGVW